jgi:hypothetical protein
MKQRIRSFLKIQCFVLAVLIGAQLTSTETFAVVIPRLEVLIALEVIFGLVFLLIRE